MHTSILAGTQNVAGIRERSDDADRARVWIHLPVGQQDLAFVREDTSVSQNQVERVSEKTDGVLGRNGTALFLCEDIRLLVNWKVGFDGVHLRNRSQDRIGPHQVANLDLCNPRNSIN